MDENGTYHWAPETPPQPKPQKKKPSFKRAGKTILAVLLALVCSSCLDWVPLLRSISPGIAIVISTVVAAGIAAILFPIQEDAA